MRPPAGSCEVEVVQNRGEDIRQGDVESVAFGQRCKTSATLNLISARMPDDRSVNFVVPAPMLLEEGGDWNGILNRPA
jgi:hypothetical protein